MPKQETQLTQYQKDLLERRKQALLELIEEMTESLPAMVKLMWNQYRSLVLSSLDQLTFEQTEEILEKAQEIIDGLRG